MDDAGTGGLPKRQIRALDGTDLPGKVFDTYPFILKQGFSLMSKGYDRGVSTLSIPKGIFPSTLSTGTLDTTL